VANLRFITLAETMQLHAKSLALFGGSEGVREPGLVESALASAVNESVYGNGDEFAVAAAYAFHLSQAQAFVDGNKRTAVAAALMFLRLNGHRFFVDDGSLYAALIAVAEKRETKAGVANVLRRLTEKT
jgi:death-on-curing protein